MNAAKTGHQPTSGEAVLLAEIAQLRNRIRQFEAQQPLYRNFFGTLPESGAASTLALPMGTWVWDLDTNQTQWSDELFRILGYDPQRDKPTVANYVAAIHPEDRAQTETLVAKAMQEGVAVRTALRVLWPNGQCRHIQSEGMVLRNQEGRAIRMLGYLVDITDYKEQGERSQRTQQLLHEAQLLADVGSWIWNLDEGWMEWSEGAWRIAGEPMRPRISLLDSLSIIHPDDAEHVRQAAERVMRDPATGEIVLEYRILRKDGSVRQILQRSRNLAAGGSSRLRLGTVLDVTETRRADEALQRSIQLLNEAQHLGKAGYWIWYLETGMFEWSDSLAEIVGLSRGATANLHELLLRVHSDDVENLKAEIAEMLATGGERVTEYRIVLPHGEVRHLMQRSRPFESTLLGKGQIRFGTIVDVTELRRAEEQSIQARFVAESALRLAKAGSWVYDPTGPSVQWSDELYHLMGVPLGMRVTPAFFHSLVHPDDLAQVIEMEHAALESRAKNGGSFRVIRPDTLEIRHFEMQGHWVQRASGEDKVYIGINIDVTERRKQEEAHRQAHKLEAIGRLAGGVAHDFNNLLTVMLGHAEEMHVQSPNARLEQILKAGSLGAALTQRLLAFSRQAVVRLQSVDVSQVAQSMGALLDRLLGEDIAIQYSLAASDAQVSADVGQIEQVILNLAINARDAMPDGGVLRIETAVVAEPPPEAAPIPELPEGANHGPGGMQTLRPHVMLAVEDTGTGMGPEVLARLFEPFFTTKEPGKGTGLGLSTVFAIVTEAKGRIAVHSAAGKGTRFEAYWPVERPAERPAERAAESGESETSARPTLLPESAHAQPKGKGRVAVVEDNYELRQLLVEMLASGGFEVQPFTTAFEAVEAPAHLIQTLDLLVTDMVMPGMHGQVVAQRLRQHNSDLPVLFISGYPRIDIAGDLDGAFLQKPFTRGQFLATVGQLTHGK
jgi:two-component system, cell cycle sensor histidine kinase and response regulator CckA